MSFSAKNNPTHSSIRKIRAAVQLDFFQAVLLAAFLPRFFKIPGWAQKNRKPFLDFLSLCAFSYVGK